MPFGYQILCLCVYVILSAHPAAPLTLECIAQKTLYTLLDCYFKRDDQYCQDLLHILQDSCGLYICGEGESQIETCFEDSRRCPDNFLVSQTGLCGRGAECCYTTLTSCDQFPADTDYGIVPLQHELGFLAYCDDNWTVIQRRTSGDQSFDMRYAEYENGFGTDISGYWLGLAHVRSLLDRGTHEICFQFNTASGTHYQVCYDKFDIRPAAEGYTLSISSDDYNTNTSTASGKNIEDLSGMKFTTKDHDQDLCPFCNCADIARGGWWYKICERANLNGLWGFPLFNWGPHWLPESGLNRPLSFTKIQIRLATTN